MVTDRDNATTPRRKRVVLLGASNLARGMSTIFETTRLLWSEPVEIFSALGHGRSYGLTTRVLGRELPGIVECGLWRALEQAPPVETFALLTDIGNDLAYGAPVETILDWVRTCLDRLAARDARITMTELPLASVRTLSPRRFKLLRALLFPGLELDLETVLAEAEALNAALVQLAAEREIRLIFPEKTWFGFDPIHIKARHWRAAWEAILGSWRGAGRPVALARPSLRRWLYLRTRAPESRRLFGFAQHRAQPSARLADGTTISLF